MEETQIINEITQTDEMQGNKLIAYNDLSLLMPDPEKVAKRADLTKLMLTSLCKVVSPVNIVNFGGRPYFDHIACERIARIVGLTIKINEKNGRIDYEKTIEDEAANHYTIYLTGKIYYTGRPEDYEIQEGSSNSFDDWYSQWQTIKYEEFEDEKGEKKKKKIVISANALPESKVREKARANLIQRLVKKFLGLDFSWEELEAVGIEKNKCRGFSFNGNNNTDSAEILDKKKEVWNKIVEICNGNVELAKKTLQKHTSFTKSDGSDFEGYTDINKVKEKPLEILSKKVDAHYKKFLKELETKQGDDNNDNETII